MKLSELKAGRQSNQQQPQTQTSNAEIGTIRALVAYPEPFEGLYEGSEVTVLATGDIVGMSPAVQIVDQHGNFDWVSMEDVTVIQKNILPLDEQRRNRLGQRRTQQTSHSA